MIGASKILTVSYGTFSCTLEGFDDPFNTMRAIAEYFRDLAADDRYFGAEPPTPDAAMLHRIAEREVSRRVEARIQDNGVILRTGDAMSSGYGDASPAVRVPAASPPSARTDARVPDPAAPGAATAENPAAEATGDAVFPPDAGSQSAPAMSVQDSEAPAGLPTAAEEPASADAVRAAAEVSVPVAYLAAPGPSPLQEVPATPRTVLSPGAAPMPGGVAARLHRARAAFVQQSATGQDSLPTAPVAAIAFAPGQPANDVEIDWVAENADASSAAGDEPRANPSSQGRDDRFAVDAMPEEASDAIVADHAYRTAIETAEGDRHAPVPPAIGLPVPEIAVAGPDGATDAAQDLPFHADAEASVENEDAFLAEMGVLIAAPVQAAPVQAAVVADDGDAEGSDDLDGFLAALSDDQNPRAGARGVEASPTDDEEDWSLLGPADTPIAGLQGGTMSDAASAAMFAGFGEDSMSSAGTDIVADNAAEDAPAPRPDPFARSLETGLLEAGPLETGPLETGPLSEKAQRARARVIRIRRSDVPGAAVPPLVPVLSPEEEAELAAELAALRSGDAHAVASATAPLHADEAARAEADLRRELETATGDESVTRLIAQTNTELQGPESRRRLSAIAHLKAAVAATVADQRAGAAPAPTEAARIDPYRDDLERVVRPRRPIAEAAQAPRPAPLMLVSAQRIDRPATPAPAPVMHPVRPRRVTSAALAPSLAELEDEDAALLAEEANIFADAKGFAEFAERLGATDLPDLLEAAAAYSACVEGRPHFSRPHLMSHVAAVATGGLSREGGLRGFGRLMRTGRIVKLKRGQFALTEDSRLLAEARKIAD